MVENLKNKKLITDGKNFKEVFDISKEEKINLPTGKINCNELKNFTSGSNFELNKKKYYIFDCDLYHYIMHDLKRHSQIVYPKEAGYILIRLNVSPGSKIGEAGTGSGALTSVFSRAVGEHGKVYTYEKRENFIDGIKKNLSSFQQYDNVVIHNSSIEEGIEYTNLDAFFLDLKNPWNVIYIVKKALKPGGHLGILVPTTNQISKTIESLELNSFYIMEVVEIMLRKYKLNAQRLRPEDRMIGHTGYLLFARSMEGAPCCHKQDCFEEIQSINR